MVLIPMRLRDTRGEYMKKVLNIIFWIYFLLGSIFVVLIETAFEFKHSSKIFLALILIAIFLRCWIYALDYQDK